MQKNLYSRLAIAALALGVGLSFALAGDDKPKHGGKAGDKPAKAELPNCPVMGEQVNFLVHTDTDKGPVYFCCAKCIDKLKANPEKYEKAVAAQRVAVAKLEKVQTCCPISGKPIDKDVSADYKGQKIHFCCDKCPAKFTQSPAKYEAALAKCYTYQLRCPVGGEEIDPKSSITLKDGGKIYFCCDKCIKPFEKDPAKYAAKLEAQGYEVKASDLTAGKADDAKKPADPMK